jgi:acetate kinase
VTLRRETGDGHVILCLNSGSSSLKFAMFRLADGNETKLAEGAIEGIGTGSGRFWVRRGSADAARDRAENFADHEAAVLATMRVIDEAHLPSADAVGHRVVHGGPLYQEARRADRTLIDSLRRLVPFAPLHLPAELRAIEAVAERYVDLPQVACFDTGFYRHLPEVARRFPLPRAFYEQGVFRYGFHGLSYEYLVEALGADAGGKAIFAHLGNGASMTALCDRVPVDTTMGLTPTGGFMMGTRTGDLDPGLLIHLLDSGHDHRDLERILNHESGLLGVSGSTSDMKALLDRSEGDERAALAVEMFCYHARKSIGALVAALGGIDTLVFTGGIGQNAPAVRTRICERLGYLGIRLDDAKNRDSRAVVSTDDSPCTVRVVPAGEEIMIARYTQRVIFG